MKPQPAFFFPFFLFCWFLLFSQTCKASASSDLSFALDGKHIVVGLTLHIAPEYHAYAHEPGETGRPAIFNFSVASSPRHDIPIYYPKGKIQRDYYEPSSTVQVYTGDVVLFARIPVECKGEPYAGTLSLLLCSSRQCIPLTLPLQGTVPTFIPDITEASWAELWHETKSHNAYYTKQSKSQGMVRLAQNIEITNLKPQYDEASLEIHSLWQAIL